MTTTTTTTIEMRNLTTGETCPAHRLGATEDGQAIFQATEGWELIGVDYECDSDGNYLVG